MNLVHLYCHINCLSCTQCSKENRIIVSANLWALLWKGMHIGEEITTLVKAVNTDEENIRSIE